MKADKSQKLSISVSIPSNFVNILKLNFGFDLVFADVIYNRIEQCPLPVTTIMALWQLVNCIHTKAEFSYLYFFGEKRTYC